MKSTEKVAVAVVIITEVVVVVLACLTEPVYGMCVAAGGRPRGVEWTGYR